MAKWIYRTIVLDSWKMGVSCRECLGGDFWGNLLNTQSKITSVFFRLSEPLQTPKPVHPWKLRQKKRCDFQQDYQDYSFPLFWQHRFFHFLLLTAFEIIVSLFSVWIPVVKSNPKITVENVFFSSLLGVWPPPRCGRSVLPGVVVWCRRCPRRPRRSPTLTRPGIRRKTTSLRGKKTGYKTGAPKTPVISTAHNSIPRTTTSQQWRYLLSFDSVAGSQPWMFHF